MNGVWRADKGIVRESWEGGTGPECSLSHQEFILGAEVGLLAFPPVTGFTEKGTEAVRPSLVLDFSPAPPHLPGSLWLGAHLWQP